jgi:histidinol-phosphatase (PHP family)
MIIDYHMHTPLCHHAVGEPLEYARAAATAGLEEICFTCHSPMPDWFDQYPRMTRAELPRYVMMVREAAEIAPLRVKLGLEADYFPGTESYVADMLAEWPFEFVLGSVHILNPQYRARFAHLRPEETIDAYFDAMAAAAATRLFDSISHPDLVKHLAPFDPLAHEPAIRRMLQAIREADICLELNTSGARKPEIGDFYPTAVILAWAAEMYVPLTLGSDAHAPEQVALAWPRARQRLIEAGFRAIHRFAGRRREAVPLAADDLMT